MLPCRLTMFGRAEVSHKRGNVGPLPFPELQQSAISGSLSAEKRHGLMQQLAASTRALSPHL